MGLIREFAAMAPERRSEVAVQLGEFAHGDFQRRGEVASQIQEYAQVDAERHADVWGGTVTPAQVPPAVTVSEATPTESAMATTAEELSEEDAVG